MKPRNRRSPHFSTMLSFVVLFAAVALLVLFLPAFRAQAIDVTPTRAMSGTDILKTSGLVVGQNLFAGMGGSIPNLFSLRYGHAEEKILRDYPYIRSVIVRMDFPGRIRMTIDERIEVSYLSIPDGCVLVDKEGFALRILQTPPASIPVIEGITVRQLSIGKSLTVDLPVAMNHALSLMGAIIDADKDNRSTTQLIPMVRRIRPVSGRNVYLTLVLPQSNEELTVLTQVTSTIGEDMVWLRFAIIQGALNGRGKGVLDMTGEKKTFIPDKT
jgi:cell division protein FtsQ